MGNIVQSSVVGGELKTQKESQNIIEQVRKRVEALHSFNIVDQYKRQIEVHPLGEFIKIGEIKLAFNDAENTSTYINNYLNPSYREMSYILIFLCQSLGIKTPWGELPDFCRRSFKSELLVRFLEEVVGLTADPIDVKHDPNAMYALSHKDFEEGLNNLHGDSEALWIGKPQLGWACKEPYVELSTRDYYMCPHRQRQVIRT